MFISDLLAGIDYTYVSSAEMDDKTDITAVCYDNRKCVSGCVFIAVVGAKFDGHNAVADAVARGAVLVVTEHELDSEPVGACVIRVRNTREALAFISANWFGNPARSLTTIALTGTKGKSTTAYMIRNILNKSGHKCAVMGTIGVQIGETVYHTDNTTPESYIVQEYLRMMVDAGCDCLVMEVSSQALKQNRVAGIVYDYALFTNLEPDHIGENEHADFSEYMYCKSLLFKQCKNAIGNADDAHFLDVVCGMAKRPDGWPETIKSDCGHNCVFTSGCAGCPDAAHTEACSFAKGTESFGCKGNRDVMAQNIRLLSENGEIGIGYDLIIEGDNFGEIRLSIPGRFNVYNSLAAISVCRKILYSEAGNSKERFAELMRNVAPALYETHVLGRLEPLKISSRFAIMIDYAHNAMALESLLNTLREYNPKRLVCLFGCGGNRSKERRFEMGEVSSKLADLTVVTSDNPRFEKPEDIIADIITGVEKADGAYVTINDRREAIRYVIENAQDGDVIVLAGKGQEDYQEIEGVKYHMDEREIVSDVVFDLMRSRGYI